MGLPPCRRHQRARDELADGGAMRVGRTIRAVRYRNPDTAIECLIPDFKGRPSDSTTCSTPNRYFQSQRRNGGAPAKTVRVQAATTVRAACSAMRRAAVSRSRPAHARPGRTRRVMEQCFATWLPIASIFSPSGSTCNRRAASAGGTAGCRRRIQHWKSSVCARLGVVEAAARAFKLPRPTSSHRNTPRRTSQSATHSPAPEARSRSSRGHELDRSRARPQSTAP